MITDAWFWRIKAAQRDLIARCGLIARSATIAECSVSWIGKCNNPNEDGFLSARQKAKLEADCGDPIVTRAELELLGFSVAPAKRPGGGDCAVIALAKVITEAADVTRSYAEGMADGKFSPADAAETEKELEELARAVEQARLANAALRGRAGGAP